MLLESHSFVSTNIIEILPSYFICYFASNTYAQILSYYLVIVKGILVPLLMTILGLWAIKNVLSMRHTRVQPALSTNATTVGNISLNTQSKDRQLTKILITNIAVYVISSLMFSVILMYQQATKYFTKSLLQQQMDLFLFNASVFIYYIPFCIEFYINFFASKTFRNEIKKLFLGG